MLPRNLRLSLAIIATLIFSIFVFGLAHSIATGFAGFSGGLPFIVITIFVFGMALYDIWDEIIRK